MYYYVKYELTHKDDGLTATSGATITQEHPLRWALTYMESVPNVRIIPTFFQEIPVELAHEFSEYIRKQLGSEDAARKV